MGSEAGVDEATVPARQINHAQLTPRYHRQQPGRPWLIGAAVIPLLLAMIGFGAYERPKGINGPTGDLPSLTAAPAIPPRLSIVPGQSLALLSISRNGNTVTLIGDFPDEAAKAGLMKSLKAFITPGVTVVDQINIDPLVHSADFAVAEPVFTASAQIPDFSLKVEKDTITLSGTAASPDQKVAVQRATVSAWPGLNVVNNITARGQVTLNAPPASSPAPAPGPPACNDLQAVINKLTGGPLAFGSDGVSLTPEDTQILIKVADQLKACPAARITVNGYTDNSSAEAINIPLSTQRATAVAEFLIANGVPRVRVTAKGMGSANPIASNDTSEGRARNRRAEIVVS
ncbi:channel-forming protein ArfA/OmpATb [Mycobacterium sp. ML4]